MSESDRDVLFANEAFVIGVLQAVSGGALVATLSQTQALVLLAGKIGFLLFLSAMALSLIVAVLAAYWKHQYKMWDVKARVSVAHQNQAEAAARSGSANRYLVSMRRAFAVSVVSIVVGILELIFSFWLVALCSSA
jgi:hypothetical protein